MKWKKAREKQSFRKWLFSRIQTSEEKMPYFVIKGLTQWGLVIMSVGNNDKKATALLPSSFPLTIIVLCPGGLPANVLWRRRRRSSFYGEHVEWNFSRYYVKKLLLGCVKGIPFKYSSPELQSNKNWIPYFMTDLRWTGTWVCQQQLLFNPFAVRYKTRLYWNVFSIWPLIPIPYKDPIMFREGKPLRYSILKALFKKIAVAWLKKLSQFRLIYCNRRNWMYYLETSRSALKANWFLCNRKIIYNLLFLVLLQRKILEKISI